MSLVQFSIELQFDKTTQVRTPAYKVFNAFAMGEAPKIKPMEPGALLKNEDHKFEIDWRYQSCKITLEKTEKRDVYVDLLLDLLETINSAVPIGNIRKTITGTKWIFPAPQYNYASLNDLYIRTVLSKHEFLQGTSDAGIILDGRIDNLDTHHESGPMEPKQLLERFLVFKHENLPKLFIFLYTTISYTKVLKYSVGEMREFLQSAINRCESCGDNFGRIWEDNL